MLVAAEKKIVRRLFKTAQTIPMQGAAPTTQVNTPPTVNPEPQAPPAPKAPADAGPPVAPGVQPVVPAENAREEKVRQSINALSQVILMLADSIYQMPLTDVQVGEIATRALQMLGDSMKEITIERVKDIVNDQLLEETDKRKRKKY